MGVEPELHPHLAQLAPFLGTWRGEGTGAYPGASAFTYVEELVLGHVGKPFMTYVQRTRSTVDGSPMHAEMGYLRMPAGDRCELVLAHPTGVTEIAEGPVTSSTDGSVLVEARSTEIGLTSSAKEVTELVRRWRLVRSAEDPGADRLEYTVDMAAVGQPLQHHLSAVLHRAD